MWGTIGILGLAGVIVAIEVPYLRKKKLNKELFVFSIIYLVAVGLCLAAVWGVPLKSPLNIMARIYKPLSDLVFSWLR